VDVPYLPTISTKPYTLVLDLDETLIHYDEALTLKDAQKVGKKLQHKLGRAPTAEEINSNLPGVKFNVRPYAV
jgi:predicted HAD superfamily phosphohydrolase YqeG